MTEQEKRETVIKGLEGCFDALVQEEHAFAENGVVMSSWQDRAKRIDAIREAIALLTAQEARVMGVDEVREWVRKQRVDREPIFIEVKDNICAWIVSDEYWDLPMDINLSSDLYGKTWRCWTSRPDEKRRAETPWES